MSAQDRYIPGVPCWVDTAQADTEAATTFYGGLFDWTFEDVIPPDAPGHYYLASRPGGNVGAIGTQPDGAPPEPTWDTYIRVADAAETAEKARAAGGTVLSEPYPVGPFGITAIIADPDGPTTAVAAASTKVYPKDILEGYEDFNVDDGGFAVMDGEWQWGAPATGPLTCHSQPSCWGTNYGDTSVLSGTLSLPTLLPTQTLWLQWWEWFDVVEDWSVLSVFLVSDSNSYPTLIHGAGLAAGGLTLEESLALFERGQALAARCNAHLDQAELKVRQLSPEGIVPFEPEG